MSTPLPRSLVPLPDESLPGYVLRLAHRLGLSPAKVEQITGLARPNSRARASSMLTLAPDKASAFAHATRLSTAEVAALTLDSLATRYPPVDLARAGQRQRRRLAHGLFVRETWVFARFSRYCPQCLTGDTSAIQQRHGGGWNKLWRLPIMFACPTHRRLLAHTCPACGQPALSRGPGAAMVPRGGDSVLHPATCRQHRPESGPGIRACGQRLDQATDTADIHDLTAPLTLQHRLLDLLVTGGTTTSVGGPATCSQYVTDLRILTCVITASWPTGRHLVDTESDALLIDRHVEDLHRQISNDHRDRHRRRDNALYDKPPPDPATTAALLAAAERITDVADPDSARNAAAQLIEAAPGTRPWIRTFLPGDGHCSPGMHAALGPEVGALHIIKRTGVPHYSTRRRRLPLPQPVHFTVGHVPQRPPPQWMDFVHEFTEIKQRLLEHVLVIRLAHAAVGGGTPIDAAAQLGIPRPAADNALRVVHRVLHATSGHEAFDHAVDNLIQHLNTATGLIHYGSRRTTLAAWEISPQQWQNLIDGLPGQLVKNRLVPNTHWGDGKRRLASTWAWTQVTHGDHIYAPAVRPDPQGPRPGGYDIHYVHTRWRHLERPSPSGHLGQLRKRLDVLVQHLAGEIDSTAPKHP
ncbi:TniQ family protein [Micromonospora sp. CA-248260]|uniref:TniQ family protein n=1 Tax=Micromonospora sp. CA-248260 TaxID=3239962 RepID=UPI003D8DA04A